MLRGIERQAIKLKDRPPLPIGAVLLGLLVLSLCVIGVLLTLMSKQENRHAAAQSDHEAALAHLTEVQEQLKDTISYQQKELDAYRARELQMNNQIIDLDAQISIQEWDKAALETFIIENNKTMDFNEDERASTPFLPKKVIALLDKMFKAISTGDKALYLSAIGSKWEYFLYPFEDRKNTAYTITSFNTYLNDIDRLQSGGYYMEITLVDDKGNEEIFSGIGVTRDFYTGKWVVYDID